MTGATVAVAASGLPFNLGLFLAATCGIATGYFCETRWASEKNPQQGEELMDATTLWLTIAAIGIGKQLAQRMSFERTFRTACAVRHP